jgi:hypothetical protein
VPKQPIDLILTFNAEELLIPSHCIFLNRLVGSPYGLPFTSPLLFVLVYKKGESLTHGRSGLTMSRRQNCAFIFLVCHFCRITRRRVGSFGTVRLVALSINHFHPQSTIEKTSEVGSTSEVSFHLPASAFAAALAFAPAARLRRQCGAIVLLRVV